MSRLAGIRPIASPPVITAVSRLALNVMVKQLGSAVAATGVSPWSDAANTVLAFPFVLEAPTTFYKVFWVNGSAAGGNSDVAIYDEQAHFIVGTGASTAGVGNTAPQVVALSATTSLPPGRYYCGMAHDATTTNQLSRWSIATGGAALFQSAGCWKAAQTLPISGNLTPAALTNIAFPLFGLITRTGFDV